MQPISYIRPWHNLSKLRPAWCQRKDQRQQITSTSMVAAAWRPRHRHHHCAGRGHLDPWWKMGWPGLLVRQYLCSHQLDVTVVAVVVVVVVVGGGGGGGGGYSFQFLVEPSFCMAQVKIANESLHANWYLNDIASNTVSLTLCVQLVPYHFGTLQIFKILVRYYPLTTCTVEIGSIVDPALACPRVWDFAVSRTQKGYTPGCPPPQKKHRKS